MIPLSERALCEIVRRLASIRTADGYSTDAGTDVLRQADSVSAGNRLVVWDDGETNTEEKTGSPQKMQLRVGIECIATANQDTTGQAIGQMRADVKRAAFCNREHLADDAGPIGAIRYEGADPRPRQVGHTVETMTVNVVVTYTEGVGNPYSSDNRRAS